MRYQMTQLYALLNTNKVSLQENMELYDYLSHWYGEQIYHILDKYNFFKGFRKKELTRLE